MERIPVQQPKVMSDTVGDFTSDRFNDFFKPEQLAVSLYHFHTTIKGVPGEGSVRRDQL